MNNEQLLKRLDEVIVNDATYTSPAEFMATHLPFAGLKYTSSGIGNDIEKSINEEDFFSDYLIKEANKHNFLVVQGDSGSGKSHFIRWAMEKYMINKDSNEVIVSIKRHQNTLKSAIMQILQSEALSEINNEEILKKLSLAKELLDDSELLYSIKNNLLTKLEAKTDFTDCILSKRESDKLIEFVKCNYAIEHLFATENGPFTRLFHKISSNAKDERQNEFDARFTPEDFNISIEFREGIEDYEDVTRSASSFAKDIYRKEDFRERVSEYLNTYIDSVIQLCLQMSGEDFRQIIYDLRKHLKQNNKVLTLFIEDITSFTGIDRSLIEALNVSNHNNDEICRLFSVVGTTTSYYNSFFPDNLKQRVTGRIFIELDSLFAREDDVVILAARYLNAINTKSDVLNHWLATGANTTNLPISNLYEKHSWSSFEDPLLGEISLFPFNKRAILHLYETLEEKTPRVFLKQIIKHVYERYLQNPMNFPGKWQDFRNYYDIPQWAEELHKTLLDNQSPEHADELSCLLRVWGNRTAFRTEIDGEVKIGDLPLDVFEAFHLAPIKGKELQSGSVLPTPPVAAKKEPKKEKNSPGVHSKYEQERMVLRHWFEQNGALSNHKIIRLEIVNFLNSFIPWQNYGVSTFLVSNFFGNNSINRVGIEGQPVEINTSGLVLEKNKINYQFMESILAYKFLGEGTWEFSNSTDYLLLVYNWISEYMDHLVKIITTTEEDVSWNMMKWAVYNQYYLCVLNGQIDGRETVEELYLKLMNTSQLNGDTDHSQMWHTQLKSLKEQDIKNNNEFLIKNSNILLGEAKVDSNKLYINAQPILQEINDLVYTNWTLDNMPNVSTLNSQLYVSYNLAKQQRDLLPKLIKSEVDQFNTVISRIKQYVQVDEVENAFYKIKSFLENTLRGKAKEYYSEEDFKHVLVSDEEIHQLAEEIRFAFLKIDQDYSNEFEKLVDISKFSYQSLVDYLTLLLKTDQLVTQFSNKYNSLINSNKNQVEDYNNNLENLKKTITKVNKSLTTLGENEEYAIK
ncbi:hypothetical protein [Halalkalibacter urbisdiaboli]|uniref:hypothetical protein n=1 Tax=Halalkalibacter urbisdiaboli TaxID=1960589 RepID=UPI000B44F81B|nr:hypothetical protein [Halalkalibacter urbisdiaboli]